VSASAFSAGSIVDVPGVAVGHAHDLRARTGCTVIVTERGSVCGVDVRGSAPGTRETDALAATAHVERVHAIVLAGGSAYGLDAACGVMRELERRGVGYEAGPWRVPIVPAAIIFDLFVGDGTVRPDAAMGEAALLAASTAPPEEGRVGAGAGASVAKLGGFERRRHGGVGSASARHGTLIVGALAVVNSIGSIYDARTGAAVAVPLGFEARAFDVRAAIAEFPQASPPANTTLAVVATNADLRKVDAIKVAQMAHDGLARTIYPAHLTRDGDTIFCCATGGCAARVDLVGAMAADAVAEAIVRGVRAANA
jgi:L-aminopeptidase/D-esterase-like protein